MNQNLDNVLHQAVDHGILPPDALQAPRPSSADRHWAVVLLTALGAWLALLPLLVLFAFALSDWIERGAGTYVIGAMMLAAAVAVLRAGELPVFLEQLALPAMLTGAGLLGFGLARDLSGQAAGAIGLAIALACTAAIPRPWLRVLLGATCALLWCTLLWPTSDPSTLYAGLPTWAVVHSALLLWMLILAAQWRALGQSAAQTRMAAALEPFATGWLLAVLAGLAFLSGRSFMVAGVLGGGLAGELAQEALPRNAMDGATQAGSAVLALAAAYVAQRAWPTLRQPRAAVAALVLAALSAFLPWLGACLLALAVTGTSGRWRQAAAAAHPAPWNVGSFYYQLAWPLATKAMVLAGCGALLGLLAWAGPRAAALSGSAGTATAGAATNATAAPGSARLQRWAPWLAVLTAACTLAVANIGIAQKERTIAQGRKVFVELAPVDPRSLMQGDYMQLNFRLPSDDRDAEKENLRSGRLYAIGKLDERGVVQWLRTGPASEPLAPGEQRFELTPRGGRWALVTDAWYFREGDGQRWEQARYGEFRVEPDGRALLVGMADAQLRPIVP
jgi:uncharacterized membrane-anchored protein